MPYFTDVHKALLKYPLWAISCKLLRCHHTLVLLFAMLSISQVGVNASMPRVCGRQTQRANTPAPSAQEYYKLSLSIPVLDELCGQMETRFSKQQIIASKGLSLVPSAIASSPETCKAAALEIATEFQADLPDGHSLTTFHE